MLGNLIGGFIVILVGAVLAPSVADAVTDAQTTLNGSGTRVPNPNISTSASTILGLTTLFYSLSVAAVGIGIATIGLRNSGLM